MNGWIKCSDRLPADGDEGLCALNLYDRESGPKIVVPFRMLDGQWYPHHRDDDDGNYIACAMDRELHPPTHWMSFPEPPQ